MANHIHVHLDNLTKTGQRAFNKVSAMRADSATTKDAGTSEGARKAAQTRAQHGGGSTNSKNAYSYHAGGFKVGEGQHPHLKAAHEHAQKVYGSGAYAIHRESGESSAYMKPSKVQGRKRQTRPLNPIANPRFR